MSDSEEQNSGSEAKRPQTQTESAGGQEPPNRKTRNGLWNFFGWGGSSGGGGKGGKAGGGSGAYGSGVRAQVFEVIVRQALAGAPWREICAGPMAVNGISPEEIEEEVKRRRTNR
jgi:hypothetical protein